METTLICTTKKFDRYLDEVRYWIYSLDDKGFRIPVDTKTINSISFNLLAGTYSTLLYTYGIGFINELNNHYIETEQYEKCTKLKGVIRNYKKLIAETQSK